MFVMTKTETAQMDLMPEDPTRADHIIVAGQAPSEKHLGETVNDHGAK